MKTYEHSLVVTKHINCLSFKHMSLFTICYHSDDNFIKIKVAICTYLK